MHASSMGVLLGRMFPLNDEAVVTSLPQKLTFGKRKRVEGRENQ